MATAKDQPSQVATEEAVKPDDSHVVTDDIDFNNVITSPADTEAKPPAASDDGEKKSDQTTEKPADSDHNENASTRDKRAERRIKNLTRKLSKLENESAASKADNEALRTEISELRAQLGSKEPEPKLEDFDKPQDYATAYAKWQAGQKPAKKPAAEKPASRDPKAHADKPDEDPAPIDSEISTFQSRGKEKLGDEFLEALHSDEMACDKDMAEFMFDSDFGPEMFVHLANNPEESRKLFDSSTRRKISALEDLEAKAKKGELDVDALDIKPVKNASDKDPDKPAGKTAKATKAGDPPDTRESGSATMETDPEKEDMDSYAARRHKEELRKRGAINV